MTSTPRLSLKLEQMTLVEQLGMEGWRPPVRAQPLYTGALAPFAAWPQEPEQQLFVGGISRQTYEAQLKEHFALYGEVVEVIVMRHKKTGISRCFGFISFRSVEAVRAVLNSEHVIDGRRVEVKRAVPRHLLPTPTLATLGSSRAAMLTAVTRQARDRILLPAWNQKLRRQHRDEIKDLRYQMNCRYQSWGYDSPDDFFIGEFPGRCRDEVFSSRPCDALALDAGQERKLQSLAAEVLDFAQDVLLKKRPTTDSHLLRPLDYLWRRAIHTVCDEVNSLIAQQRHHLGQVVLVHEDDPAPFAVALPATRRRRKDKPIMLSFAAVPTVPCVRGAPLYFGSPQILHSPTGVAW
ncbi:hypothetical protein CTAYLR_000097 [Chrysophaeum taylorii]|uniref:RRM domain-containing protein n=1 Tax=Chrysophaeum taylorii TaxID=2483200 RepID=A0AAD7UJ56_9STRA|nr:hypothetical protein CTAYLR_000097 [Chrysophaeum taylorii]